MPTSPDLLRSACWLCLHCLVVSPLALAGESFNWYQPVSGSFDDPARWQYGFNIPPNQNPGGKVPGPSDRVGFGRGNELPVSYEVRISGGTVDSMAVGTFGIPALTQPLTLRLSGTMTVRWLELRSKIMLIGGGELAGSGPDTFLVDVSVFGGTTLRLSSGAQTEGLLLDNAKGVFQDIAFGANVPSEAMILRNADVRTSGGVRFGGLARLEDSSQWQHQGDGMVGGQFNLKGHSSFTAAGTVELSHSVLEGGSTFQAENILHAGFGFFTMKEASSMRAGYLLVNAGAVELFPSEISGSSTIDATIFELRQGFLKLSSGSKLTTSTSSLGTGAGSAGITVTGEGSQWTEDDHLAGGNVRVMDGGLVTFGSTAQDVYARVQAPGSKLLFKHLYGGSKMFVSGGATASGEDFSASDGGGSVEGKGSSLKLTRGFSLGIESIGLSGFGIAGGGSFECEDAELSSGASGSTTMSVSGAESSWRIHEELSLGKRSGAKATLEINQGGKVTVGTDFVPSKKTVSIGGGSAVRVADAASVFDTSFVGKTVVGAEPQLRRGRSFLSVSGGASALVNRLEIAPDSVSDALVSVDGPNSKLHASARVVIGIDGGKGALEVRNGGKVIGDSFEVGNSGNENVLLITGAGASMSFEHGVFIGDDFSRGTVTVADGAQVSAEGRNPGRSIGVGVGEFSEGRLVATGQGTKVDLPEDRLTVGFFGTGKMTVSEGAEVKVAECALGYATGSSATVLVTGADQGNQLSSLSVSQRLDVGSKQDPAPASLEVAVGGRVSVGNQMRVGPKGVVLMDGGGMVVGKGTALREILLVGPGGVLTLDFGARLNVGSGRLVVRGGEYYPWGPVPNDSGPAPGTPTLQALVATGPAPRLAADVTASTRIEGGFSVEEGGSMRVILGSSSNPLGPGPVLVTGPVSLGGKLVVQCVDGFAPSTGQRFEFLASGTGISGDFAQVEVLGLASGFRYQLKAEPTGVYTLTALSNGSATSRPRLHYSRAGGQLTLSWPETAVGFILQRAPDPAASTWRTLPTEANRTTVPLSAPAEFFRLAKP